MHFYFLNLAIMSKWRNLLKAYGYILSLFQNKGEIEESWFTPTFALMGHFSGGTLIIFAAMAAKLQ